MKNGKSPAGHHTLLEKHILRWYRTSARSLPWRRTRNPFKILISEVMLQQTQVSRVRQKYGPFLRRFPSPDALARATPASVIRAWSGMGYNNRAVRLRSLAQTVVAEYGGRLPRDIKQLRELPGIGKYTAHAVACFAYGQPVPVVDTNISRVLSRLFPKSTLDVWDLASRVLPKRSSYEWNQGLMELGATICRSSNPRCSDCPIKGLCPSAFMAVQRLQKPPRNEPGRDGVPNRIYRGRIIDALRNRGRNSTGLVSIGKRIKPGYSPGDRPWLLRVLANLERDGLILKTKNGRGISVRLAT